jgi:hypothetical protein
VCDDWSKVEPLVAGSWRHDWICTIKREGGSVSKKARIERVPRRVTGRSKYKCHNATFNCGGPRTTRLVSVPGKNGPLLVLL